MEENAQTNIHITSRIEIDRLHLHPNKHLILQALQKYNITFKAEYFDYDNVEVNRTKFLELNNIQIFKSEFKCKLIYEKACSTDKGEINDFYLEFYLVYRDSNDDDPLLLNLDDLLFYLNWIQNHLAKKEHKFSELEPCSYKEGIFNFNLRGRDLSNKYFPDYKGPALHSYFEYELIELYAILSDNLAFLYRYKDRVFEEINVKDYYRYQYQIFMHPRFNNAISETAGSIYNFWERIAFFINEFYPLNANSNSAPSYWKYFDEINKRAAKNSILKNIKLDWFVARLHITKEHERLNELRHPLVHYNKTRNVKGTRSADFIERQPYKEEIKKEWEAEILFLRNELDNLSTALENILGLIEIWALAKITI